MHRKCYSPIKGIDDVIAANFYGWNKYMVASLRGIYDESHETPLDTSDISKAVEELASYRRSLLKENSESIRSAGSNLAESYQKLKESFSAEERFDRVNMISLLFSDRLDALQNANPELSRKRICNGFPSGGQWRGGQFAIFNGVYEQIFEYYAEAVEEGNTEEADKFRKVLENWGALVAYARVRLRDTEGLRLGNNVEYADDTTPEDYGDNKLAELYDASEAKQESWQETADMRSSFGSVGKQVRKLLSTIQDIKDGEEQSDDLGFPKMIDPIIAHQALLETLRGITSESNMMEVLRSAVSKQEWLQPIIDELENNYLLRTQFFVDFRKNFQPYSIIKEVFENGVKVIQTIIKNKTDTSFSKQYLTRISLGRQVDPNTSVFDRSGNVNWENLQKLRALIKDYFPSQKINVFPKFFNNDKTTWQDRRSILLQITKALGIDVDGKTLDRIMSNGKDIHHLANAITELVEYGIEGVLRKDELDALDNDNFDLGKRSFKEFITFTPSSSTAKEGVIREKINKILTIVTKNREGLRLESRVRHKDSKGNSITLFSDVLPSYLGDKLGKIASFVNNGDQQGLRDTIKKEFLNSPYFMDGERILNRWLRDLYENGLDEKGFAANFTFKRFLGYEDVSFENFTSKQHAIDLLAEFFSERQISPSSQYAYYPVFILGDSGVAKMVKAKRYSEKDILDGLYDVYRQERRRMSLTKAANEKLTGDEHSLIDNFSSKENVYTLLTFLNKDYKSPDGTVGKYAEMIEDNPSEQNVKKAIKAYMKEAVEAFKTQLDSLGVLETTKRFNPRTKKTETHYVYFGKEVNENKTIDDVIKDYYWNTKFATIQQLQLFTIDPAFYKGTKDLQKRYKEIHAPGEALSIEARNPYSEEHELFSKDGIERCVYFEDISLNAEFANSKFMEAIAAKFGKESDIYEAYTDNSLTDGQGYRTLDSYRKVMGMAGKWTLEMENTYKAIKQLRAEYGIGAQIPAEKLDEIARMAVVFQPIKPFMYTIENYAVNDKEMLKIPVQHKYAEAVLIPELLPAGSQLRDMAYWMESKGVDLVCSTKAVKVGGFGTTDISKASNAKELNGALDKALIHQLSYADYRIQTNVPEHINSSQLFGTQVRKLIMAGINMDSYDYEKYVDGKLVNLGGNHGKVRLNGRNLISFYNSLIVANILDSYDTFAKDLEGAEKLSKLLTQSTISNSRESIDNLIAYSLTGDEKFLIPLFEGGLEHDSAALLLSVFKKLVNKQSIKGGSAVQVSAMGITGYELSGDLKAVVDPNDKENILYVQCEIPWDLSYKDANGNEVALEFSEYCNDDGTLKVDDNGDTLLEKRFPGILDIVAYRIPTERAYSMINLKVKRFSQKTAGGTIKVPVQFTTVAGFDFDIDKLYFMRNEYVQDKLSDKQVEEIWGKIYKEHPEIKEALLRAKKDSADAQDLVTELFKSFYRSDFAQDIAETSPEKDRLYKYWKEAGLEGSPQELFSKYLEEHYDEYLNFESYVFDKTPLENSSRAARNNMLIKIIRERLMDRETFKQRYTPGGFKGASTAARTLRELMFGDLQEVINDGVVDFDAIHRRAKDKDSDPEPNYDPSDPMTIIIYNQQNQVAGKLIGIFANQNVNHAFASLMQTFALKDSIRFAGHDYYDLLHSPEGVDTDLTVAELLAASVDAVKDPVLNFLNLNNVTANAGALLARIGYTTEEIGLLFNQPIIKEICEYSLNNNMPADMAMRDVIRKYIDKNLNPTGTDPEVDFSANRLALNIVEYRNKKEKGENAMENEAFIDNQLKVAELFSNIWKAAGDVSQFISASKFTASNAVGSTFGDMYAQQMKVRNYLDKFVNRKGKNALSVVMRVTDEIETPITNGTNLSLDNQKYLESLIDNPLAYEQAMYDMNRRAVMLLSKYYPYDTDTYKFTRDRMALLTKGNFLDADTINSIHSDLLVYMLAQEEDSLFNGDRIIRRDSEQEGIPAREYYTKHFAKTLYNILEDYPELKKLPIFQYMEFVADEKTGDISMNVQGIGGLAPHQKDALRESWADLLKTDPVLATDLFMYNFYKLGFTFSPTSFMNLAPTEVKLAIKVGKKWDASANNGEGAYVATTYIDFLNKVLAGDVSIDIDRFARQYILNHLDNRSLVFTPKRGYLDWIKKEKVFKNRGIAADEFTLSVEELGEDAKEYTINDRTLPKNWVAFRPCIVVEGIVYMCDNEGAYGRFNVARGSITYRRVDKLGTTNKSLQYTTNSEKASEDNNQDDERTDGSIGGKELVPEVTPDTFNREEVINEIFENMVKIGELSAEDENSVKKYLNLDSEKTLKEKVERTREKVKNNGLIDNTERKVC